MSEGFDAVFHGDSESECFDFICAVRQHAKDNGKIKDNAWIADELFNAFRGKALKWYLRLPEDVQGDWGRLQGALLTRWTTDDEVDDISASVSSLAIVPTAAAAPAACPPNPTPSITSPQTEGRGKVGRVRIRATGTTGTWYLSKDVWKTNNGWSGAFSATTNAALALKVRLVITTHNFYKLELVDHESGLSVLAAFNFGSDDWNAGPSRYQGFLVGVDMPGSGSLEDCRTTYDGDDDDKKGQFWTERWQIETTEVLKLCGPEHPAEIAQFTLYDKGHLFFVGPKVSLSSTFPRVDLSFEPLDN